jgi:hypothetical protein
MIAAGRSSDPSVTGWLGGKVVAAFGAAKEIIVPRVLGAMWGRRVIDAHAAHRTADGFLGRGLFAMDGFDDGISRAHEKPIPRPIRSSSIQ